MKQKIIKLWGLLMALTMCLSLGVTAFAAESDNDFTDVE